MKNRAYFPWHIFLLPVFYILHVYNQYFHLLSPGITLLYLLYYLLLSGFFFLLGWILFRNSIKAGVWTTSFLAVFFFFGALHDFIRNTGPPASLQSYTFVLALLSTGFIILSVSIKRKKSLLKLNRFFLALTLLFVVIESVLFLFNTFTGRENKLNPAGHNHPLALEPEVPPGQQSPDIFFIVFDAYTSTSALKKYYRFDNSELDSLLLKNHFYISHGSQSNYNATPFSMASTFDMQYFNTGVEHMPNNSFNLLRAAFAYKKSRLPALLESKGYKVINHGLMDLKGHPVNVTPVFKEDEIKALSLETLWGRIQRDILWNITTRLPGYQKGVKFDKEHVERDMKNFSGFLDELKKQSEQPRFVVGHLLIPRRPACVDRYGNLRNISMTDFTDQAHDSLYIEQLIYANTLIDSLVKAARQERPRPLVLIIEGDHGNRYAEWGKSIREKQFMNLNTYYFSDHDYSQLYDSISPVNSFRVILNKYFRTTLPLLKDSTIHLN